MTGNRDVVVVNQQFDVQILSNRQAGGFRVIAFHLRSVGSQHEDNLARIRDRHSVYEGPHVSQAARGKLDSGSKAALRMSRKMRQVFTIVIQFLNRQFTFECGHQVLCRDAVTSFIEKDG